MTWSPGARELQVWSADAEGALAPRGLPVGGAIVAVAVDPDLPRGERPLAAVVTAEAVLAVPLQGGPPVVVARGSHRHAGLLLGPPPRVVVGGRTDRLALLTPGGARGGGAELVPAPAPADVLALAAGSGTLAVLDAERRAYVWTDVRGAEGVIAPVASGTSIAVAHGRALVGSAGGICVLAARDMTLLGEIEAGVAAPVDAVALAHGAAALLAGRSLVLAGEVGPPWAVVDRPPGARAVALDPTGRVALVSAPTGVEVWALAHRLAPFAVEGAAGLAPAGRLPGLDPLAAGASSEVAWLAPDRLVVASPTASDRRRLRVWELLDGHTRPGLAVDTPACGLAVVGGRLVLEEPAGPLLPSVQAPGLDGALLVTPEPGGTALVGVSGERVLMRLPLSPGAEGPSKLGALQRGALPAALAVAADGRVALASWRSTDLLGREGIVEVWDPGGARPRSADRTVGFPSGGRPVVAFSPDGRWLAVGFGSGALLALDAATADGPPDPERDLAAPGTAPQPDHRPAVRSRWAGRGRGLPRARRAGVPLHEARARGPSRRRTVLHPRAAPLAPPPRRRPLGRGGPSLALVRRHPTGGPGRLPRPQAPRRRRRRRAGRPLRGPSRALTRARGRARAGSGSGPGAPRARAGRPRAGGRRAGRGSARSSPRAPSRRAR